MPDFPDLPNFDKYLNFYILDENQEVKKVSMREWMAWVCENEKNGICPRLRSTMIGSIHVSTVFLGQTTNLTGVSPLLWETMIFGIEELADYGTRSASKAAALKAHEIAIHQAMEFTSPNAIVQEQKI